MALSDKTKLRLFGGGVAAFLLISFLLGVITVPEENVLDVYACKPDDIYHQLTATLVPKEFWGAQLTSMWEERRAMAFNERVRLSKPQLDALLAVDTSGPDAIRAGDILWADSLSACEMEIEKRYGLKARDVLRERDARIKRRLDAADKRQKEAQAH